MRALSLVALFALVAGGCSGPPPSGPTSRATRSATGPLVTCTVGLPDDVTMLLAWDEGVVVARGARVQRMHGAGCALAPFGAPVAAEQLLDVDDHGALYVFPAESALPDELSTMLDVVFAESTVARVSLDDNIVKLMHAGRGIWSFGVAPAGDALWLTSCGPTGLYDVTAEGVATPSTMEEPQTQWRSMPAVLGSARMFWSVGARTCDPTTPSSSEPSDACGLALVRSTPDGDDDVGQTVLDFGDGFEQGTLQRCGANVCGVFASAVVVWDARGDAARTLMAVDVGAAADESIVAATANQHGIYLTLHSVERGTRVIFTP